MGVPFVALEGGHVVSRMGYSALKIVGLPELCGGTTDAYVDIAVTLALDPYRLRAVRQDLRGRIARSPHMDHAQLASDVSDAFRAMWHRWVEATSPA